MATEFGLENYLNNDVVTATLHQQDAELPRLLHADEVSSKVCEFLYDNNYVSGGHVSVENLNNYSNMNDVPLIANKKLNDINAERINELLDSCNVGKSKHIRRPLIGYIASCLAGNMSRAGGILNTAAYTDNLRPAAEAFGGSVARMFATEAYSSRVAMEAFGVNQDAVAQDTRLNIVIAIMKATKSPIDRAIARVTTDDIVVTAKIRDVEIFDLAASRNPDAKVRWGNHRRPYIHLLRHPEFVDAQAKPVIVLAANDTSQTSLLFNVDNSPLKVGKKHNLFSLAIDGNKPTYESTDMTDFVSEGAIVDYLTIKVTKTPGGSDPDVVEYFDIKTSGFQMAKLTQATNSTHSTEVVANMTLPSILKPGMKNRAGATSATLADLTDAKVMLDVYANVTLQRQRSETNGTGSVEANVAMVDGTSVDSTIATEFAKLKFELVGYHIDAKWTEENARKTTLAAQENVRQISWEIPVMRGIIHQWSMAGGRNEDVVERIGSINNLGCTSRSLSIIRDTLEKVADRNVTEYENDELHYEQRVNRDYICGIKVNPYVVRAEIDYSNSDIDIMRESEKPTELHAYFRKSMLDITAQINTLSLYPNVLDDNETLVYKIYVWRPLKDLIVGHGDYHNTLDDTPDDGAGKEGRRPDGADYSMKLQNGVRLDFVALDYESMRDMMYVFPTRVRKPDDTYSAFINYDRGTWVATYQPTIDGGTHNRVLTAPREMTWPQTPVGAIIKVTNLDEYYENVNLGRKN